MQNKNEFIQVVQENEGLIYKVAKLYTDSREDEQDLYQEIVYQLWKSFDGFRNESKISTWMYRIALNTSIAHLNRERKKGKYVPIDEAPAPPSDNGNTLKAERIETLYAHKKSQHGRKRNCAIVPGRKIL